MDGKVFLLYLTFPQDLDVLNMVMIDTTIFETKAETSGKCVLLIGATCSSPFARSFTVPG